MSKICWDILEKPSKIRYFIYTTIPIIVTWQAPRAHKVSKIATKVVQKGCDKTCKLFAFAVFSQILQLGGWYLPPPPPDAINLCDPSM